MQVSFNKELIIKQFCENQYVREGEATRWSVICVEGKRGGTREVLLDNVAPVIGVWWDSSFFGSSDGSDERNVNADYALIFRDDEGIYVHTYRCAGYSTMTFDPDINCDFMPNGTLDRAMELCLDDQQREYVQAAVNELILGE